MLSTYFIQKNFSVLGVNEPVTFSLPVRCSNHWQTRIPVVNEAYEPVPNITFFTIWTA